MEHLLEFCRTDAQRAAVEAAIKHGSQRKAASEMGLSRSAFRDRIRSVKAYAASKSVAPSEGLDRKMPEGFKLKGFSDMRTNEEGKPIWYKADLDKERQFELMKQAVEGLKDDLPVYPRSAPAEIKTNPELLNCFVLSDAHLGMLAWGEETGDDWDLQIAECTLRNWMDQAIKQAPDSKIAVFAQIGDAMHWDGMEALTPASGHVLDADSRFQKLVRVAVRVIRYMIDSLLLTHEKVHVIMATGNHDLASSVWLREMVAHVYEDEPRLSVDLSPDIYYCYEHGDTSLFFHHGHKRKPSNVTEVFAAKFRKELGRTSKSYAHMGHLHHHESKENGLMIVEQHQTLAAKDAHASQGGYMAQRAAKVITYHKKHGEVSRVTITPEMCEVSE